MIRNKISRSPEDLSKDKPAASKILSFTTTFAHFVSDDNGTTWPQAGEVTQNISVTVGNPNYPNKGKVTVSGSAEGKVSNGSMVFAVQALVEVDDYGVDLTVAIWGVITKSGTATVTNEGYKQIDLGDQLPAALSVVTANGDQVMSFTGSGNGQLHAIQVP